jgi:AAA+ ATPase superfamily predicted ATPase
MESEVLHEKSPLYGRRSGQIHLGPFDCYDAALMLPGDDPELMLRYYATFGGTPYYLEQIDASASYEENIANILFDKVGLLYEEPTMLLRQELREPATYNSILAAIAHGATEPARIADWSGVSPNSVGKYLRTLSGLGLVERKVPFGSNPDKSRSGVYSIADPFFAFWYRFVGPAIDAIELGAGGAVAAKTCSGQALSTYEGTQFEKVCMQWLARKNGTDVLPFLATSFGRWWGTSPEEHAEVDVDVIAASKQDHALFCGECKWRNDFDETEAIALLEQRSHLIPGRWDNRSFALFSKRAVSAGTLAKARVRADLILLSAEDLFSSL